MNEMSFLNPTIMMLVTGIFELKVHLPMVLKLVSVSLIQYQ